MGRELGLTVGTGGGPDAGNTSEPAGVAACANRNESAEWFRCGGFARNDDEKHRLSLMLTFARGRVGDAQPFSHLEMRYSTTPLYWENGSPHRRPNKTWHVVEVGNVYP